MELTLNEYQDMASTTATYRQNPSSLVVYPALGLGEAGEVQGKIKKLIRDGDGVESVTPEQAKAIAYEIGDVLWYCAALAGDLGFELGDIAQANLDKLFDRQERGVIGGSGDNR
jgi:NTP pyrophosphatase (non-canonical NTP hydrolase)